MSREVDAAMFLIRRALMLAALAAPTVPVSAAPVAARAAAPPMTATVITCTNPASGATWQLRIDLRHATVDANPATISADEISWRDARDGGNNTLDRKTGALTIIVASSTGGFERQDRCRMPP